MAKGDGSITEVRRGVWRVRVDFGTDPVTKKRKVVSRNVYGTKVEARKVRDQIRQEHESGLRADADKLTLAEFADQYHEARCAAGEIGKTHLDRERNELNTISAYLGSTVLRDITPQMVESLYAAIRRDKTAERGSYSGTTLNQIHGTLKRVLQKAVDYDLIMRNPCDRVKAPKKDEPERRSLSIEEGARLLSCINEEEATAYSDMSEKEARQTERGNLFGRDYLRGLNIISNILAVRIGLATGARRGEVFGLCWGCIDLDQSCIHIRQSLTSYGELKPPKSKAGVRSLFVDAVTAEHLRQWKDRQAVELLKIGIRQDDGTPVCCSEKGGLIDLHNFERWWRQFRVRNGFEDLKFHELRHTQATQLLANGVDVKTVQTRLGHSNASLTLNWYAHAIPENDERAAQLVGTLFATRPESTPILKVKTA
ncbi:tyrosine-type recombinase/integrase [Arabiibacter massiliensis]|uniref:tyrosine-type recombinase/integrase n=1 Tax=Arabiibacter massiliensis TaxID=1870985 RepID=UPI0009BA8853|nr:site-specific integrase [Arabiibacter massiliensis]